MSAFRSLRLVSSLRAIPTLRTALPLRYYASSSLSKTDIEARVLNIVKAFDKVKDPSKISATSTFANDLGLDSLDTVEVVMAIEEEFNVEIPDKDADEIKSVGQAIEYIAGHGDGKSNISGVLVLMNSSIKIILLIYRTCRDVYRKIGNE